MASEYHRPPSAMIPDHLARHARKQPDAPFRSEDGETYRFGAFFDLVTRLAARLHAAGLGKGERVVLYMERRSRYLATYLAAMTLGAIPVLLSPRRQPVFVAYAAAHSSARLVVSDGVAFGGVALPCPLLRYPGAEQLDLAPLWPGERHEIAYLMYTGGATGTPKAVMVSHENVAFATRTLIVMAGITRCDREIVVMPLDSNGGLAHFHANLALGNPLILPPCYFGALDDQDLHRLLDTIEAEGITGFLATPAILARLAATHREDVRRKARRLRYLLANLAPLPADLVRDLLALLPETRLHSYYGLTEASHSVHLCCNDHPEKIAGVGRPSPGMAIRIAQPNLAGIGEVQIKGPSVMAGYWGLGEQGFTSDGWLHSGDLGSFDGDGYLTLHGRLAENRGGDGLHQDRRG